MAKSQLLSYITRLAPRSEYLTLGGRASLAVIHKFGRVQGWGLALPVGTLCLLAQVKCLGVAWAFERVVKAPAGTVQ